MILKKVLFLFLLAGATIAQAQTPQPVIIPLDSAVRIGKLSNGLTYYIRYNNWPEHRANFYIAQKVGSLQEEENQRGLAHFLEHMCFNGTKHFKGDKILRYCESIGVQFGSNINAYTGIDQTVYNISDVPTTRQSSLDSCLLILHDWADELTLDPKEIDKERGVIHEEWRMRSDAGSRMFERNLPKIYPGSKYGLRYPIGLMSVVDNFKPKELNDYYETWYHPTNQGIIVVGDVDVDHVEAEIKKLFGGIKNPKHPKPIIDEDVPDTPTPIVIIDKDKEQQETIVELMFKHDIWPDFLKNNTLYFINNYTKDVAFSIINNRLDEAAQKPDCPFVNAGINDGNYIYAKTKDAVTLSVTPKDMAHTSDALKEAMKEVIRAAKDGFTDTEYERKKKETLSVLDMNYSNREKRTNDHFYNECRENFLNNEPMSSIDFYYNTMKGIVPSISLSAINETIKNLIPNNDANMVIMNFNNEKEGNVYPTEEELLNAVKLARTEPLSPYVDQTKNEPLISAMPKKGMIITETKNDKLGYSELKLSNGATVILKKTDFRKDAVSISGEGLGGYTLYGEADYNNIKMFNNVINVSGLGNFSSTELRKAMAGKMAGINLSLSEEYTNIGGWASPKDVESAFQLTYLYFTSIKKDAESYNNLIEQIKVGLKNRDLDPNNAYNDSIKATVYGHSKRLTPLTVNDLSDINYDRILQMAKERTENASGWTFTIIGNYNDSTIRPLICKYLASLPVNGTVKTSPRVNLTNKGIIENVFKRKMETPKATAYMLWSNTDMPYTLENKIRADIAGQILSMIYIKKIREDASAAYSCGAYADNYIGQNYRETKLQVYCPMKPEKKDIALKIMNEEVAALAKTCDASMLNKAKEYTIKKSDDWARQNGYWDIVIYLWRKYGINEYSDYKKIVAQQTPESICTFMKDFLKAGNQITVVMLPEDNK